MPTNITDVSSFDTVQVPIGTDGFSLSGLVQAYQNLANRTRYLRDQALVGDGVAFTGSRVVSCGANLLTITGSSSGTNIVRTAGTVTMNGATGATVTSAASTTIAATSTGTVAVSAAGGNVSVSAGGSGNVALSTSGTGDVTLTSASDISLSATTNVTTAASKLSLTGAGHPSRSPAIAFTDEPIRHLLVPGTANYDCATFVSSPHAITQRDVSAGHTANIELVLSPGCTYTSFSLLIRGATGGTLPTNMPRWTLTEHDGSSAGATAISSLVIDGSASNAIYVANHEVVVTPTSSPLRPSSRRRYYLSMQGASGGGAAVGLTLFRVRATGSCDTFGVGVDPIPLT